MNSVTKKIVFFGPSAVGKTQLINVILNRTFTERHVKTIGIDFCYSNQVKDNNSFQVQLWDTAGEDKFKLSMSGVYRDVDECFLVISAADEFKPDLLFKCLEETRDYAYSQDSHIQIVVNKTDLEPRFTKDQVQEFIAQANERKIQIKQDVLWVSAKTNDGIKEFKQSLLSFDERHFSIHHSESAPKETIKNNYPASYRKICNNETTSSSNKDQAIALLRDYTKGTTFGVSSMLVLLHGHFKRHHTSVVKEKLKALDNGTVELKKVLEDLKALDKNRHGSLARRLNYIDEHLVGESDRVTSYLNL